MTAHHRSRLRQIARVVFAVFLVLVAIMLIRYARSVDWSQVIAAIDGYRLPTLVAAASLTSLSYLIYCGYDLAARAYSGHDLSTRRVMAIAFTSYTFSLNIGALVGSAGFRYRLYSHSGLGAGRISRIIGFAVATNWLGYLVLAGGVFAAGTVRPPRGWEVGAAGLQLLGWVMLAVAAFYFIACRLSHGRVFHVGRHHFRFPSLPLALLQVALAVTNWSVMAAIVYVLMPEEATYPSVLGIFLIAAVASAIAHIPAGIGALEAVFTVLLYVVPQAQLLAALLTYRAFYYLAPLLPAIAVYAAFEATGKKATAD